MIWLPTENMNYITTNGGKGQRGLSPLLSKIGARYYPGAEK